MRQFNGISSGDNYGKARKADTGTTSLKTEHLKLETHPDHPRALAAPAVHE
jgi:hypothetical protein